MKTEDVLVASVKLYQTGFFGSSYASTEYVISPQTLAMLTSVDNESVNSLNELVVAVGQPKICSILGRVLGWITDFRHEFKTSIVIAVG